MAAKKRGSAKRKSSTKKRAKPKGAACRRAEKVVTNRKRDYQKALTKIKSLKKATKLAEKSANKRHAELVKAQNRAKAICRG